MLLSNNITTRCLLFYFTLDFVRGLASRCPTPGSGLALTCCNSSTLTIPHELARPGGRTTNSRFTPSLDPLKRRMLESNQQDLHRLRIYDALVSFVQFYHLRTWSWFFKEHYDTAFFSLAFILVFGCCSFDMWGYPLPFSWSWPSMFGSCYVILTVMPCVSMSDTTSVLLFLRLMRLGPRQYGSQDLRVKMLRSPQYKRVFHALVSSILPFAHLNCVSYLSEVVHILRSSISVIVLQACLVCCFFVTRKRVELFYNRFRTGLMRPIIAYWPRPREQARMTCVISWLSE